MKHTSEWDRMTEEEKSEFCRNSKCPYYYGVLDDCMYDECDEKDRDVTESCKKLKKHIKDSTELSGGHLW